MSIFNLPIEIIKFLHILEAMLTMSNFSLITSKPLSLVTLLGHLPLKG